MADDILDCARQAEDAIGRLARITVDRPSLTPADIDVVIASLAEAVAALPQAVTQLGYMLQNAADGWHLTMDSMSGTSDPSIAIDTARIHLDAVRRPAVEVYRHLDAAHQDTAHIAAEDPWDSGAPDARRAAHRPGHRPPPPSSRPAWARAVAMTSRNFSAIDVGASHVAGGSRRAPRPPGRSSCHLVHPPQVTGAVPASFRSPD